MKKKVVGIISLLACVIFAFSVASCGGKGNANESGDVVLSFLHAGTMQKSTPKVEKAVSDYCKDKLGFGIKFKQCNVYNCDSDYRNWLVGNEEVDILNVFAADPLSYVKDNSAREISSLLTEENAPYLSEEVKNRPNSIVVDKEGTIYGISVFADYGFAGYSYVVRRDVLEEAGLYSETAESGKYTDYQQVSYADLDIIFDAIQRVMPVNSSGQKVYPCPAMKSIGFNTGFIACDTMGSEAYPMAVMMADPVTGEFTGEIENYYATDDYKQYIEWIGRCNEKGYILPDAETTPSSMTDLFRAEQFVGVMLQTSPELQKQWETDHGYDFVFLPLTTEYVFVTSPNQALMIPSKSKRPERAIKFIDLLYSDEYLVNLIMYGVEGEEYKFLDKENGYITEQSKGSRTNNYVIGGFWGDYSMIYSFVPADIDVAAAVALQKRVDEKTKALQAIADSHTSPAVGFLYIPSRANSTTIRNISANVMSQYYLTLACGKGSKGTDGTYTGEGSTYDKFIKALDKAKINNIIQDKRAQYNEWKNK